MSEIEDIEFADEPNDAALKEEARMLLSQNNQAPKPVERTPEEQDLVPNFVVDFAKQVGGGVEDAFKSTVSLARDVAFEWEAKTLSQSPEEEAILRSMQKEGKSPFSYAMGAYSAVADAEPVFEKTQREGVSGGVLDFTRVATQYLAPFGLISKSLKARGVVGAPNLIASTGLTSFTAIDPAQDNLANVIQEMPALQNPITEYLASDGSDAIQNRFKNALLDITLLGVGAGVVESAKQTVKQGAKLVPVKAAGKQIVEGIGKATEAVADTAVGRSVDKGFEKLVDTFVKGVEVVRQQRLVEKGGLTQSVFKNLAGMTAKEAKDVTVGDALTNGLSAAAKKEQSEAILTGVLPASEAATAASGRAQMIAQDPIVQDEFVKKVFGKGFAEFDKEKILASTGLVDDPAVANAIKFATEQADVGAKIPWDETTARAFKMTLEEAQARFGTAGDMTAALTRLGQESAYQSAKLLEAVKEKGLNSPEGIEALAKSLNSSDFSKMASSEAGRALGSLRQVKDVNEIVRNIDLTTMKDLEGAIKNLADEPEKLLNFNQQLGRTKWSDLRLGLRTYWQNSVLSGLVTHLKNIGSNVIVIAGLGPAERFAASGISALKGEQKVFAREAAEMYVGFYEGFKDAIRVLRKGSAIDEELAVKTRAGSKFELADEAEQDLGRQLVSQAPKKIVEKLTRSQFNEMSLLGRGLEFLGRALVAPNDFLGGTDQFMKMMAARGEKRALAYRDAMSRGLTGDDFAKHVDNILTNQPINSTEKVLLDNINDAASAFARSATLTDDLEKTGKALSKLRESLPGSEYILPFVKTIINQMDEMFLKRTPLGLASSRVRSEFAAGGARAANAQAKMAVGTGLMGTMATFYQAGYVTGAGPQNPSLRKAWLKTHQPYSVKVNGEWYRYENGGIVGGLMALGARLAEVIEYSSDLEDLSENEQDELAFGTIAAVSNFVTDRSVLIGLDGLFAAMEGDKFAAESLAANTAGGFVPFSGLARTATRAVDEEMREMDGIFDRIYGGIPGLSGTLPERRDRFGDVIVFPDKVLYTPLPIAVTHSEVMAADKTSQKIAEMEAQAGVTISTPDRQFKGIKLTAEEYSARMKHLNEFKIGGQTVKERLVSIGQSAVWERLPSGQQNGKGELIKNIYRRYLSASDAKFLKQNGKISAKVEAAKRKQFQQQRELNPRTGAPRVKETFVGAE